VQSLYKNVACSISGRARVDRPFVDRNVGDVLIAWRTRPSSRSRVRQTKSRSSFRPSPSSRTAGRGVDKVVDAGTRACRRGHPQFLYTRRPEIAVAELLPPRDPRLQASSKTGSRTSSS